MGMMLPKPVLTSLNERCGNNIFRVGSACVNGYRENMEDAHIAYLKPTWGFFGVFDGHVNDHCSNYLEGEWARVMDEITLPITDERMKEIALEVDKKYMSNQPQGGSTGTFFLAEQDAEGRLHLQVGNVGDSRVIVCRDGQCVPMTEDHKPTNPGERRRILSCGGTVENARVNGSLALSRAFGDADYKRFDGDQLTQQVIALPDVTRTVVDFNKGNYAVLACDGVFEGEFSNEEVITYINDQLKSETDLAVVSYRVCEEAIRRGSKDNISCMIVMFAPGGDYVDAPRYEFVPGPLSATTHGGFMKAYWAMCAKGGVTPARCLELRYDHLMSQSELDDDATAELQLFDQGPPANLSGAARTQWFETIAQSLRGMPMTGADQRSALVSQLQQRGISINAFLDAMRSADDSLDDN
jgi:protein phosphatase